MTARELTSGQRNVFQAVVDQLGALGYRGGLLARDYRFSDWFLLDTPERIVPLAAFGQTPASYETACFAVLAANDSTGADLIQEYRALGAPFAFEIHDEGLSYWIVGKDRQSTRLRRTFTIGEIPSAFAENLTDWSPDSVLRAKNITYSTTPRQLELFDYELVPEIEGRIKGHLDPRMRDACSSAVEAYLIATGEDPNPSDLFRLAFWMLAGKVLHDRGIDQFEDLSTASDPDTVLAKVASHYDEQLPQLLTPAARAVVHEKIWAGFDYRNLSIEVLTHIWATTFVTAEIREKLGIHPTPRVIAKYIVDSLPFENIPEADRIVLEPCCGSGTFLLAALQRMRDLLTDKTTSQSRHEYLKARLIGFEHEPFGIEISRLSLTLADFPNHDGWQLFPKDVFNSQEFVASLPNARIVLCNPPFEDFDLAQRGIYNPSSIRKPAELLDRVLSHLHPNGMLGFVLPRLFIDGAGYRRVRERLAMRFGEIDIVALPDKVFETSSLETSLLLAHSPKLPVDSPTVHVRYCKVREGDWTHFRTYCSAAESSSEKKTIEEAAASLAIQPLSSVWASLKRLKKIGEVADIQRGIEWEGIPLTKKGKETGNRDILVKSKKEKGYYLGIPPRAKPFWSFQCPPLKYLCMYPEYERGNSYQKEWGRPKVIMNKATKSRDAWRVAAFADFDGLRFYQTFTGIWPHDPSLTMCISAVLNGPVANAFISTTEGKLDITSETLERIPVPVFSDEQKAEIDLLVARYSEALRFEPLKKAEAFAEAADILRHIDAAVLVAYDLPPREERKLLDYFENDRRIVPFTFGRYFPEEFESYFSLRDYLSPAFRQSTIGRLLESKRPPQVVLDALTEASEMHSK